ncbi:MAG: prepilin-type N-terminal cleavage/methylation domain-containing protein [Gammaproteobacteria bacterium]|nr:prepilin-type N-terminal cleavage/methylation domain-containing protein [Gammaproteobacteria bacterium]
MTARGFTLLEFVIVIVIVAVLSGFLLDRVLPLIGQAERVAFQQARAQVQSALLLEAAERIARGESRSLGELAGVNPMSLLLQPPGNYLGELSRPRISDLPRATWHFDDREGRLVYRPGRQAKFETLDGPEDRIQLAVSFVYTDRNGDGRFEPSVDEFDGLRLASVHPFRWLD